MKQTKQIIALLATMASPAVMAADVTVTADITADTTWTSDNEYILERVVFVKPGATLTIEPGTKIYGTENLTNGTYGSLVVTRGATLVAEGTRKQPIEFTALVERDGFDHDDDPGTPNVMPDPALGDGGFWGGVVLLGSAPINYYAGGVNLNENDIEGFPGGASSDILYGGSNPNDSSGILKYVSIRFGGYEFAANSEINGLTLGGVGAGTEIEYVEVVSNTDDGVEIFGGTVNTKHIAVAFCQDDSFDLDEGHQGHHQFWFALQNADDSLGDNLGEWDGGNGNIKTGTPYNLIKVYNATLIGSGTASATDNDGIAMENNFAGTLANSVITDVPDEAIKDKSDGIGSPKPIFLNNTWGAIGDASLLTSVGAGSAGTPDGSSNDGVGVDVKLRGISRDADGVLDPRPASDSPLLGASLAPYPTTAPAGFFSKVDYRGAFASNENWLDEWSYLSRAGYITPCPEVVVGAEIAVDTTWTKDNCYILDKVVFVKPGATLTIEPGTKIYGTENLENGTYGSLVVTRGAKLIAEGTVNEPIEFTALVERDGFDDDDDASTPNVMPDPALGDGGYWGGVVLLGSAPINYYAGGVNLNENDIEGFPGGASSDILYGGSNPNDSSGILKYVSIRFGGYEFAANSEINGLTLGGVGAGTEIEYVEVVSNTDDGVEIFGGTVNTKHIAVAFCQDDSFDLDEGHQGHHQFWFALQNEDDSLGDNLGEWDGGNGNIKTGTPYNLIKVYNATLIGSGTASATDNDGIAMENNFAGTLANSVITDVPDEAIKDKSDGVGDPKPIFLNNTWGIIGDPSLQAVIGTGVNGDSDPGTAGIQLDGIPNGSINGSTGVDPMLIGISRNPDCGLDPRPEIGSPLRGASLAAFPSSAPSGFFDTVNFRGAFGDKNWLNGWSYLYRKNYLSGLPDGGSDSSGGSNGSGGSLVDSDGDGISDEVESANSELGFNPNVSNGTPSTVFDGLYTEAGILDLVTGSQIMVQGGGAGQPVTLSLPLFRSEDMSSFTPAPALDATFNGSGEAEFYRIEVSGAE
ncbi:hypothetical protein ACFQY0_19225 [Haloferula chungangensis]|uniref:Cell surface glycoprotein n=1 Tax=Haloferula chungangensis TaxID=1048331 RepID=A0ABW2LA74_9BACT